MYKVNIIAFLQYLASSLMVKKLWIEWGKVNLIRGLRKIRFRIRISIRSMIHG